MKHSALDIPDSYDSRVKWLEDLLVSGDLNRFIAEVKILQGNVEAELSPLVLSAYQINDIKNEGLKSFSSVQIRELLKSPEQLFELQDIILECDTDYWNERFRAVRNNEQVNKRKEAFLNAVRSSFDEREVSSSPSGKTTIEQKQDTGNETHSSRRGVLVVLALAASALFILWGVNLLDPDKPNEFDLTSASWIGSGTLHSNKVDRAFLDELANVYAANLEGFSKADPLQVIQMVEQDCLELKKLGEQHFAVKTDWLWVVAIIETWIDRMEKLKAGNADRLRHQVFDPEEGLIPNMIGVLRSRSQKI